MKFRKKIGTKVMAVVIIPTAISILVALYVAAVNIQREGKEGLVSKSEAILNRMKHVRTYVANQGSLPGAIQKAKEKHPDGKLPLETKERIKKQVPIIASWEIGEKGADADNYSFRISSLSPRNEKHQATAFERKFIEEFKETGKKQIIYTDDENDRLLIMSPVYLNKAEGCLTCHGKPETSPFGNGKDILGYDMENMKDGDMKGMFTISSDLKPLNAKTQKAVLTISFWGLLIALIGITTAFFISKKIINGIKQLQKSGDEIAQGNYDAKVNLKTGDELEELSDSLDKMVKSFKKGVDYAGKISKGDLRSNENLDITNLSTLEKSLMSMEIKLTEVIESILNVTEDITGGSNKISHSSSVIATGANEQAASTEEVSASMEEMVSNINQNTDNAINAERISAKAAEGITEGNKSFTVTVEAMREIADKITIVGDIAKRTDILAINAAIEAARAGEHGKGFAVVANEVRKLAENSRQAAERIEDLVQNSVGIAVQAGKKLEEITPEVQKTSQFLKHIVNAGNEQNTGANQINDAIQELTKVIQVNTEAADQMAMDATAMAEKANILKNSVSFFKVNNMKLNTEEPVFGGQLKKKTTNTAQTTDDDDDSSGYDIDFSDKDDDDSEFEQF